MIWSLLEWILGTVRNFLWRITGAQKEIDFWYNRWEEVRRELVLVEKKTTGQSGSTNA